MHETILTSTRAAILSVAVLAAAACGASDPAPTAPEPAGNNEGNNEAADGQGSQALAATDIESTCRAILVRQRECKETFLPALVDLRVRLDVPVGIAAEDAEKGRDALLAMAEEEYAVDSADEAIAAACEKIPESIPVEQRPELEAKARECLSASECSPFVDCSLALMEAHLK